ncbi:O-antigen ligase family protein [Pseudoalteromonas haloplanktis]|uniref:O-antigen ligase family protein n=1 Tax=Pseudoalteromonas haloplanktis TaxID=228 RepID=A0ABU1BI41_PSEHA|nr:O-antigen ligase family protein [Pseudoalteromonas haloplanktis]MDQ9094138.1 O-antigen ligase family protein [Pseudoalteromonas haloplanktis]
MISQKSFDFKSVVIYIFALSAPLSTTFLDKPNLALLSSLFFCVFLIGLVNKSLKFNNDIVKALLYSYFFVFLFSIIGGYSVSALYSSPEQTNKTISRIITMCLGLSVLIVLGDWLTKVNKEQLKLFIKLSFITTCIFALLGIYQIVANKFNLPFISTRSDVYGTSSSMKESLGFRLTSIAREPNFYSPILFESICLAFALLNRNKFIIFLLITLFLMFKTLSTGVYAHAILFFTLIFVFSRVRKIYKIMIFSILGGGVASFIYMNLDAFWLQYFMTKLQAEVSGSSLRSSVYITVLRTYLDSPYLNLFFGHGLNSLTSFDDFIIGTNSLEFAISNNLYIDFLWDSGVFGLLFFILGVLYVFMALNAVKHNSKAGFSAFMMLLSLLISSLYRSEYTTTHFFWVLANIVVLYCLAKKGPDNDT